MSEKQYEKDKKEVIVNLSVALQQIVIGYPDIAFECIDKAEKILSKYSGITEEDRKHLAELEYDPERGLIASTDRKEKSRKYKRTEVA